MIFWKSSERSSIWRSSSWLNIDLYEMSDVEVDQFSKHIISMPTQVRQSRRVYCSFTLIDGLTSTIVFTPVPDQNIGRKIMLKMKHLMTMGFKNQYSSHLIALLDMKHLIITMGFMVQKSIQFPLHGIHVYSVIPTEKLATGKSQMVTTHNGRFFFSFLDQ